MKKIISWFLLLSFINLTGCYSHELLAPSSYKFDEKKDITIVTKDTTYKFKGHQYIIVNDTLLGSDKNVYINKSALDEPIVKIPVDDMQLVEVKENDARRTALAVVGGAVVLFVVYVVISFITTDWHFRF